MRYTAKWVVSTCSCCDRLVACMKRLDVMRGRQLFYLLYDELKYLAIGVILRVLATPIAWTSNFFPKIDNGVLK